MQSEVLRVEFAEVGVAKALGAAGELILADNSEHSHRVELSATRYGYGNKGNK